MKSLHLLSLTALLALADAAFAQGTAFTYQGRLNDGSNPATGIYDLRFAIYDSSGGPGVVAGPRTNSPTVVSNGLFTVTLDFGAAAFSGAPRWIEIGVRSNAAGSFATLAPRTLITAVPYAILSRNLSGTLPATQLNGVLPSALLSGAYSGSLNFNNPANSFAGSGSGLTTLNASQLAAGVVSDARLAGNVARTNQVWLLGGNAGTTPGTQFLGTTDNQPLEIRVNGLRAMRLEPAGDSARYPDGLPDGAPNVIGGSPFNHVAAGVVGATIAGGGATNYSGNVQTNAVFDDFGVIGGGSLNTIFYGATFATIGGGSFNKIQNQAAKATIGGGGGHTIESSASSSTIGGGEGNTIQSGANFATIAGGYINTILPGGDYAAIPGGLLNSAARYAFAAGQRAKANHTGTFVWADATGTDFASTATNQFLLRASGGVGIGLINPAAQLEVSSSGGAPFPQARLNQANVNDYARLRFTVGGDVNKRWDLACRSNVFVIYSGQTGSEALRLENNNAYVNGAIVLTSDRNAKKDFAAVNAQEVLEKVAALPLQSWSYTNQPGVKHVGPTAQDFRAAFGLGEDDKHIATVDADGVALAAIQGLNQILEQKLAQKQAEISELKARLDRLEQRLNQSAR